jgi:hypothetical protein
MTTVQLPNQSSAKSEGKTPYKAWHGHMRAVGYLHTFRCLAYVKELNHLGGKLLFTREQWDACQGDREKGGSSSTIGGHKRGKARKGAQARARGRAEGDGRGDTQGGAAG